jgi:hypothetical protein
VTDEQILERFHRALIEEIQTQRPEYLTGPFTVAEIYQNLVPYGSHRDRIGVEINGDYEDALLRLLSGEGGFLILESEPALRDIRAELETSHPNTGLYREYAAVDVRLNQARLDLSAAAIDELADLAEELEAEVPVPMAELAPSAAMEDLGIVPPGVDIFTASNGPVPTPEPAPTAPPGGLQPEFVEPEPPARAVVKGGDPCAWCRARLPDRPNLNYCPFCGTDLSVVPCPQCREELEPTWRFCIACGTEVGG